MSTEIKAPTFPESVADGTIATWHKQPGEQVSRDELLVDIETDKVVLEIVAPDDGVIESIIKQEGDIILSSEVIGTFAAGATGTTATKASPEESASTAPEAPSADIVMSPAAKKMVEEKNLNPQDITASGKDGRLTKEDVINHLSASPKAAPAPATKAEPVAPVADLGARAEKRVPMTRLRSSIARRLLDASQNTAMLTTFNEVNMKPLMDLRKPVSYTHLTLPTKA